MAAKLHAAEDVFIDEVASHAGNEEIADAQVKHILHRDPAVEAGEDHRLGKLPGIRLANPLRVVSLREIVGHKAAIARQQLLKHQLWRERRLLLGSQHPPQGRRFGGLKHRRIGPRLIGKAHHAQAACCHCHSAGQPSAAMRESSASKSRWNCR